MGKSKLKYGKKRMKIRNGFLFAPLFIISLALLFLTTASEFQDLTQGDFNNGTMVNVEYNSSGFLQLSPGNLTGNFISQVFNAGSLSAWNNISWAQKIYSEPDELSGLVLWSKADSLIINDSSNKVSNWGDLSGNNNNFTQPTYSNQPTWIADSINGQPTLRVVAASQQTMYTTTNFPAPVTVLYVSKLNGGANYRILAAKSNNWLLGFWNGAMQQAYFVGWVSPTHTATPNTNPYLYEAVIPGVGQNSVVYENGNQILSNQGGVTGPNGLCLSGYTCTSEFSNADIAEIIVYNRTLSDTERISIENYLGIKYGLFYEASLNLSVRTCNDTSCSGESWTNLGSNLTSPQNLSLTNNTYFQYKFDFLTDNAKYSPELYNVTINYNLLDTTPPSINLNSPANNTNTSLTNINFNFTAIEDYPQEVNCSIYLDSVLNQSNSSVLNNTLTNFNILGISEGLHTWGIVCVDGASNSNTPETRSFYVDLSGPIMSNLVYSPNSSDDVDPGTNLTFNASVSDVRMNVSAVILQYHNGSDWANETMSLVGSIYQANITTIDSEANYTYRIWRNDSFGNSAVSSNQTFSSIWDCSWSVSPSSLEETIGFYEDKPIGNITIINTGDSNYTDNNCSIIFATSYNGFSSNYWSSNSWISNNRGFQISSSIIVNASSNETFQINASFPSASSPFTETPAITLTASINDSITKNKTATVSSTVITSPPNPLLYQEITDYPTTFIYLTPGSFNLSAYVRNLGGDDSDGNTAYNVSFNWTLPSSLSSRISEGDTNVFYSNFTNNSKQFKNLTINFTPTNILSMSKGILNITLYSYGYNNNSELITNSGNQTLLNNTINIQFLCYDGSDGLCVSDCGVGVDPDCAAPSAGTGAGGGGGGSGSGTVTIYEKSSAIFELLRGDVQEFVLPIKNSGAGYKKNIQIKVSGIKSEYISISPSMIPEIAPFSSENVTVTITAPSYFTRGVYELIFSLKGEIIFNGTSNPFSEVKEVTLYILEVERSEADILMGETVDMISYMNSSGLVMRRVLELFDLMNKSYDEVKFLEVKENYLLIKDIYDSAVGSIAASEELRKGIAKAEKNGMEVLETKKIMFLADAAFRRGDYVLAFEKYTAAKLTYALETKGKFSLYHTVKNNPLESLLALIGFGIFSFGSSLAVKRQYYKRKLKLLGEEEKLLLELMKVVQLETFENNKMSMEEYGEAMSQYETKLSKTVEERITIETKLSNLFKINGKKKALKQEKERLVELIKELQDKYLNKANVETRIYENMMKSYTERISDVEGKLTFLDAQNAMKRFKFWGKKEIGLGEEERKGKGEGKGKEERKGKDIKKSKSLKEGGKK